MNIGATRETSFKLPLARAALGYTLIELLAAMVASTVLLASLAGTVVIATQLLEAPAADALAWRDREIADRVSDDLRYAKTIDESPDYGFQVTKVNVMSGDNETAAYEAYLSGLTRQIDAGLPIQLDEQPANQTFAVDGYTAPTYVPNDAAVTVRAVNSAVEPDPVGSISCRYPTGCRNGDIVLLFMAARTPNSIQVSPTGWNVLRFSGLGGLRYLALVRSYDSSNSGPTRITFSGSATATVVVLALENASNADSANWLNNGVGFHPITTPAVLEPSSGTQPYHLNLQVVAANGNPWPTQTVGVASFADCVTVSAGSCSLGVAVRNGPTPLMSTTPEFWQRTNGAWIQSGIRLGNGG